MPFHHWLFVVALTPMNFDDTPDGPAYHVDPARRDDTNGTPS